MPSPKKWKQPKIFNLPAINLAHRRLSGTDGDNSKSKPEYLCVHTRIAITSMEYFLATIKIRFKNALKDI